MTQHIPSAYFDFILNEIAKSDTLCLCTFQPTTFFNAVWPSMRNNSQGYSIGDLMRPPTPNSFIYECLVGGTSGTIEPVYGVVQDAQFSDGSVTWKSHSNYSIANASMDPSELTITNETYGRKLTTPQKASVVHISGIATHTALICLSDRTLKLVTTSTTTQDGNNLISGRSIVFQPFSFNRYNL